MLVPGHQIGLPLWRQVVKGERITKVFMAEVQTIPVPGYVAAGSSVKFAALSRSSWDGDTLAKISISATSPAE